MKTFSLKKEDVNRQWYVVDATDKVLGRLATKIADRIMGTFIFRSFFWALSQTAPLLGQILPFSIISNWTGIA